MCIACVTHAGMRPGSACYSVGLGSNWARSVHSLVLLCDACSRHTHLHSCDPSPRISQGQSDSALRDYYIHNLQGAAQNTRTRMNKTATVMKDDIQCVRAYVCTCVCSRSPLVSTAGHCMSHHIAHSSHLLCCADIRTLLQPTHTDTHGDIMRGWVYEVCVVFHCMCCVLPVCWTDSCQCCQGDSGWRVRDRSMTR